MYKYNCYSLLCNLSHVNLILRLAGRPKGRKKGYFLLPHRGTYFKSLSEQKSSGMGKTKPKVVRSPPLTGAPGETFREKRGKQSYSLKSSWLFVVGYP